MKMNTRRHIIKLSLVSGIAASTRVTHSVAQDAESTPAAGESTRNGVFTNVLDQLPRADDGELAAVAWGADVERGTAYALIHNATDEEFIMRQGWGRALDAEGNIIAEVDKVEISTYSWESDSYGLFKVDFRINIEAVAEMEFEFPTVPLSEDSGELVNVRVVNYELVGVASLSALVHNDADFTLNFAPVLAVFFDDEMNIVAGAGNPAMQVGPDSESRAQLVISFGEPTDKWLFAAFGA